MIQVTLEQFAAVVSSRLAEGRPLKQGISPYAFLRDVNSDPKQRVKLFAGVARELGWTTTEQSVEDMLNSIPHGNVSDLYLALRRKQAEQSERKKNKLWWLGSAVLVGVSAFLFVKTYFLGSMLAAYVYLGIQDYLRGGRT